MAQFEALNDINIDDIIDYCQKNKQVAWLKSVALKEGLVDKNGKPRKPSFIEIRNAFVREFFPELAPKPQVKKPTMYERIFDL